MKRRTLRKTASTAVSASAIAAPAPSERPKRAVHVAAGNDRFNEHITLGGAPNDCRVSALDTGGAMSVFEFATPRAFGPPRHVHHYQDEWFYVLDGEFGFEVGDERFRLRAGESLFAPREIPHAWASISDEPAKMMIVFQPAGTMEAFFRELSKCTSRASQEEFERLFRAHGMEIVGPPLSVE